MFSRRTVATPHSLRSSASAPPSRLAARGRRHATGPTCRGTCRSPADAGDGRTGGRGRPSSRQILRQSDGRVGNRDRLGAQGGVQPNSPKCSGWERWPVLACRVPMVMDTTVCFTACASFTRSASLSFCRRSPNSAMTSSASGSGSSWPAVSFDAVDQHRFLFPPFHQQLRDGGEVLAVGQGEVLGAALDLLPHGMQAFLVGGSQLHAPRLGSQDGVLDPLGGVGFQHVLAKRVEHERFQAIHADRRDADSRDRGAGSSGRCRTGRTSAVSCRRGTLRRTPYIGVAAVDAGDQSAQQVRCRVVIARDAACGEPGWPAPRRTSSGGTSGSCAFSTTIRPSSSTRQNLPLEYLPARRMPT